MFPHCNIPIGFISDLCTLAPGILQSPFTIAFDTPQQHGNLGLHIFEDPCEVHTRATKSKTSSREMSPTLALDRPQALNPYDYIPAKDLVSDERTVMTKDQHSATGFGKQEMGPEGHAKVPSSPRPSSKRPREPATEPPSKARRSTQDSNSPISVPQTTFVKQESILNNVQEDTVEGEDENDTIKLARSLGHTADRIERSASRNVPSTPVYRPSGCLPTSSPINGEPNTPVCQLSHFSSLFSPKLR